MIRPLLITATLLLPAFALAEANTAPNVRPAQMQPAVPFKMDLPEGWKSVVTGTTIKITIEHYNDILIRPLPDAKAPADAVDSVAKTIVGEVTDFKSTDVKDIKIAGAAAKHVLGTGKEADDGDPSNTEVFLFTVNSKTYSACVHGEGIDAEKLRPSVIRMLDSAKAP